MSKVIRLEQNRRIIVLARRRNDAGMKLAFDLHVEEGRTRGKFVLGSRYGGGAASLTGGINRGVAR